MVVASLWVLGLVLGRWWIAALVVGTVGWPLVVLVGGGTVHVGEAAVIGYLNTAVGVAIHQILLLLVRLVRRRLVPRS